MKYCQLLLARTYEATEEQEVILFLPWSVLQNVKRFAQKTQIRRLSSEDVLAVPLSIGAALLHS